ncbi:MAG: hypothetical protein M3361_07845 [Candidatus Tectomicrobia bacterium]|nr:hypothetical protein [Candidatus Tectomicrobia bacterium]
METPRQRLAFAITFAGMDLAKLRPGDWTNLVEGLKRFLSPGPGFNVRFLSEETQKRAWGTPITWDDVCSLQRDFQSLLNGLVATQETPDQWAVQLPPTVVEEVSLFVMALGDTKVLFPLGRFKDMALLTLAFLLTSQPTQELRRCPECHTIFLKVKHQRYCSRSCANRVYVREWRASHPDYQAPKRRRRTHGPTDVDTHQPAAPVRVSSM